MKKTAAWLVVLLVLVGAGLAYYFYRPLGESMVPVTTSESLAPAQPEPAQPKVRYPIVPAQPQQQVLESKAETPAKPTVVEPVVSLPPLDESDAEVAEEFGAVTGREALATLFNVKDFIRRVVVTVDNLPRRQVPPRYIPTAPVEGRFVAQGEEGGQYLSQDNYKRYTAYVRLLETVSAEGLVDVYVYLYPLFQEAYQDLGYPDAYFNDRLVEAIDNLLQAPVVEGPIWLARPSVMFKFADPELEALSAGQKIMIRMGPNNAARVKSRLRDIREMLMTRVIDEEKPVSASATTNQ